MEFTNITKITKITKITNITNITEGLLFFPIKVKGNDFFELNQ